MSRKKEEVQVEKKNPNLVSYGEYKSRYGSGNLMSYDNYRDWYSQQQMKRRNEQARYNSFVEEYKQKHPTVTTPKYTYTTPERKDYGTDKTGNNRLHQRPGSLGLIADAGVSDMPTVKPAQVQENDPEDLKGRLEYLANYGIPIMQERGENGSTRNALAETPDERNSPSMYIKERPKDYWTGNNRTDYDRWMYDSIYGSGAYDRKIEEELETDEDYDQFDKSLDRMWHSLKYGGIDKLFEPEQEQTDEEDKLFWDEMYRNQNGKLYGKGNIDLNSRQVVNNPDGSYSTELSTTVGYDDGVYLIPTVVDGKIVSTDEAIKHFEETGEYLGKFDNEEDAQDYALKLHQRQEERYKYTGYSGDYTFGGKERPLSQSEIYDIAEKDKKGETAGDLLNYENWKNYLNTNPYTKWDNLEEDKRHWDFVQGSSGRKLEELGETGQEMLDQWDAEYSDPMLDKMITELPALITVPADYEQRKEYYDRMLYDWAMGEDGWYDNDAGDPIREERLEELWEPIRSGKVEKIARINQGYDQYVEDYNDYSAWNREAGRQLEQLNYQEGLKESYDALIDQYNDNITDPNFMPEYDKGTTNPNNIRVEIVSNNQTNNIDRIASFIGGGNEFKSWAEAVFPNGEPKVTPDYNYAMMLLDGYDENGVYHADRDEKSIFLNLYNQAKKEGRDPKEARAFLDGMKQVLRDRYSEAESIQISEVARKYPVAASLVDLYFRQINAGADVVRHIAGALGDESVKDPNSGYYTGARFNEKTEQTIMNNLGPVWGKAYQSVMESASNLIRALTTAGAPSRLVQTIESLGQMWLQVDLESTRRNIEKVGYEKASALGALDATSEVIEELMPFEVMLGSGKFNTAVSMLINSGTEGLEEFFGATFLEKVKGRITGDDSEQARSDQIYTQKGYVNGKGEWVDLSNLKDKKSIKEIADFQARKEFISNVLESTAGGFMGGWLGGTYGEINRVANTIKTGRTITNKANTNAEGVTGTNQLIKAAAGLEGTESQRMAEDLQAAIDKGKKPSNYQIGKLAANMAEEVGERYKNIVEETIENRVVSQLKEQGVNPKTARTAAKAIAKNLTTGELSREDRKKISQDERAVELWKTYNSTSMEGMEARTELVKEVGEATKETRSVADLIGDLTGKYAKATSEKIAGIIDESNRVAKNVEGAIDEFAKRRGDLMSTVYADAAKIVAKAEKNQKTFLEDAVKIRMAVFSLDKNKPSVRISEESAQKLTEAAEKEMREADNERIRNQKKIIPGEGQVTFNGAEYGTEAWKEKVDNEKGLHSRTKMQMNIIAEIGKQFGNAINFINDPSQRGQYIHGYETGDGTITINVAGIRRNGMSKNMLATLAHEMTHWLEQNSQEGYNMLREFIVDSLRSQGIKVEQRLLDIIDNQNTVLGAESGQSLDMFGAMAELVAQSCENLFSSDAMRQQLEKTNPTVYNQVKSFVRQFMARLKAVVKELDPSLSEEAKTLKQWNEKISRMWLSARDEALGREEGGTDNAEDVSFSVAGNDQGKQYSLEKYTEDELMNWRRSGNIQVYDGNEETLDRFINWSLDHKDEYRKMYFGKIDKALATRIEQETGYKTEGLNLALRSHEIIKIMENDHGNYAEEAERGQIKITAPQILEAVRTIEDPDTIEKGTYVENNKSHDAITFRKEINGRVNAFTYIITKRHDLAIETIYKNIKKESLAPDGNVKTLPQTSKTSRGTASNSIVSQRNLNSKATPLIKLDRDYAAAVKNGNVEEQQNLVDIAADKAMPDSKIRDENGKLIPVYHGTTENFNVFDMSKGRSTMDIQGAFFSPWEIDASGYGDNVRRFYLNITNPASEAEGYAALRRFQGQNYAGRKAREYLISKGYDGVNNGNEEYIAFYPNQIKSADPVTYDDNGTEIPLRRRFSEKDDVRYSVAMDQTNETHPAAAQFSVAQFAQANGMRFDENDVVLYNKDGQVIDGVRVKVTEDMIEKTPVGMLINMARDGITTKGGKFKFKATISAETAKAQKKMFTDLMNMIARYKDSNLVWEIAGSQLYSAMKSNSDPQYSTTVDFGTVCAKTQEIINVMSRVMLEKGRGLNREEVLMVYNETANAGLTVPCPVCYVFSRWMGVPSLLNQMSQYQKRFVIAKKDAKGNTVYDENGNVVIDVKKTQEAAQKYIQDAMDKYGSKAELDKAKTSIMNRMKTQEKNRSAALVVLNSQTATAEEKAEAKRKHDDAIRILDDLTKDLGEVEAYNWVTQALLDEKGKVDKDFVLTPDEILFDLRKTGEFAKYTKNWRYRNTRGAGMGKAIMPYSGETIGDIIFGTERKSELKNSFLQMKAAGASTGIKNAIIRARKQNLIGGQRLQSTSDFRPEWGLDYIMTFLELQAIGSKVQMYTKVAEAVDLLASMGADINLSIMGKGSGFHEATAEEIRESRKNTRAGRELRSRMGTTTDENGNLKTYVLDFSDVTGMDYNTAKALKNKHNSVQMILVGMNDIHIRLAMANKDIDFIIPWHSSGNSQDALKSMIASVGERLETSSDYTDYQSDKASENQTAAQKKLWDLRMKILQGKEISDSDQKIIDRDEWLSSLYDRFNVPGVDEDCYQVKLGKEQAAQIFPYEYWNKELKKADADENGRLFVEYCEHFGIIPRFSQFMNEEGYWKLLIDRTMYDNDGNYREQQVVDVTKAKVGSLDAQGRLQGSDMPLKTSAMYGDGYSAQEKTATDNTLAALDMKAQLEAIGENVITGEEGTLPRNNQSTFAASTNVPTLATQETSDAEEFAPARQQARYADEDRRFSVVQPDMDVRRFMLGLNENSLSTEQERTMLRQFKELNKAMEIAQHALDDRTKKLRELEKKPNPSAFDKDQMQRLRNRIKDSEAKVTKLENEMAKVTRDKGYAALMARNEQVMRNLVSGKTTEQVRETVAEMTRQIEQMDKLLAKLSQTGKDPQELENVRKQIRELMEKGEKAIGLQQHVQQEIGTAINYNNNLTIQSEAATWKRERWKLIEQLKSEHTQALLEEQAKWKAKIAKDQQARQMMMTNQQLRNAVHLNVTRLWKLLASETDQKNIPEHMKGLAREMIGMIVGNDLNGRKISGIDRKDLMEMLRVMDIMERQDGKFTPDDLRLITDEEAQDVVMEALADLEDGIKFYNASTSGNIISNLQAFHNALDRISDAVEAITNIIRAEMEISIKERKVLIQDAADDIIRDMERSRFKGELKGFGARQLKWAKNSVVYGNTTPVFFFKNLRNRGMTEQWEELKRGQNRNGLETEKAKRFLHDLADRTHYQTWAEQKHTVKIGSRNVEMTVGNMMELYAIWKREMLSMVDNPQSSSHLRNGGIIIQQQESNDGKLRREHQNTRPMRVTDQDVGVMYDQLTDEQKQYLDEMVKYLSSDMSDLGNEASMRMYGIKKYKEKWYFPMKIWDGVKSARSDRGISGTNDNRAAHKGWSKRRVNKAQNALVIGDFTQDAVGHIVEMINYNTMAPAIENINKILNYQQTELDDNGEDIKGVKRNVRVMFGEAYGQQALNYLETFLKDLNGGVVQDQRSTLRDKLISVFRKNAVAGSLSVALQQPLSYIRAAMMINPKYLAQAISPTYWKNSHEEMTKYSGVAVIKDMGRFDMNFGANAREYIAPEQKTTYEKITNKLTVLPELMDRMTWTRMWSAVKLEQHQLHPEMDINDEAFLKIVAERFNDVMMQTQVYDSVLVRSQNMRSDKLSLKMLTSFMAEPTLSLNILSDAVLNFKEQGGKLNVAKAAATFSLAAVFQAFFKGLMGSGRSPDEKKTWLENFLSKWQQNFISEINPISLVPGYGDLIELLKNGELKDDAMGVIGKITTAINTIRDTVSGKKEFGYRTIEDTAAQIAQLFTNIPYKNILRDLRAMYNYVSQEHYAKRGTSGAVLREQAKANRYSADNLLGVLNTFLGEAGFKTSNAAYYERLFNAMQNGNQAEVSGIREYLMLIKGQDEKKISSGLSAQAKNKLDPAAASQWAIDNDMMNSSSTLTTQYKKDQITREEYKKLLKQQDPKLTEDDIWWKIDRVDYQKETGAEKVSGYGYRLKDAINNNKAAEISRAVNDMMKHGIPKEKIKKDYLSDWKKAYLEADSNGRRKIRDALQKACKAAGYTAADADAMIAKWEKEKNK